jgi:hypothetical protein
MSSRSLHHSPPSPRALSLPSSPNARPGSPSVSVNW